MSDTKYLTQNSSGLWQFFWRVPSDCIDAFDGKKYVKRSLETHSLRTAQRRRQQMLAECLRIVDEVRAGSDERSRFKVHARAVAKADPADLEAAYLESLEKEPTSPDEKAFKEALRAEYKGHVSELAKCTLKEALGVYKKDREGRVSDKTLSHASRAVETYLEHTRKADVTLESIKRPDVKQYIQASAATAKGKTISNRLTFMSAIFKAAQDYGHIDESKRNPFDGHRVERKDSQSFQQFTKQELRAIFDATEKYREKSKDYHKFLLPRLAYATGCRLEELCSLQRAQIREEGSIVYIAIAEGVDVYKGKTLNAGRRIPIHSSLAAEVLRWRDSDDHLLLFPVLESKRADGKLGDKYGKSFGRLKTELGITGGRHKGFHSFRVHMATNLEQAEVPESRAVWILGHTRNLSLSYGLYSKGPSLEQLRVDAESAVGYGLREELGGAW
ncbi:site-specific integrase [uncultured Microbulbifer sp.]|uniref:site-specific integrase n=1 Tax=uncultured Microbulbifer sp. TaxID=348147 RepID=UPI0025EE9822|nr:site-specific integrase [uncultured Microbulbifer sp.]